MTSRPRASSLRFPGPERQDEGGRNSSVAKHRRPAPGDGYGPPMSEQRRGRMDAWSSEGCSTQLLGPITGGSILNFCLERPRCKRKTAPAAWPVPGARRRYAVPLRWAYCRRPARGKDTAVPTPKITRQTGLPICYGKSDSGHSTRRNAEPKRSEVIEKNGTVDQSHQVETAPAAEDPLRRGDLLGKLPNHRPESRPTPGEAQNPGHPKSG